MGNEKAQFEHAAPKSVTDADSEVISVRAPSWVVDRLQEWADETNRSQVRSKLNPNGHVPKTEAPYSGSIGYYTDNNGDTVLYDKQKYRQKLIDRLEDADVTTWTGPPKHKGGKRTTIPLSDLPTEQDPVNRKKSLEALAEDHGIEVSDIERPELSDDDIEYPLGSKSEILRIALITGLHTLETEGAKYPMKELNNDLKCPDCGNENVEEMTREPSVAFEGEFTRIHCSNCDTTQEMQSFFMAHAEEHDMKAYERMIESIGK